MKREKIPQPHRVSWGIPEAINDRIRLRLVISEEIKKKRGIGTTRDIVEKKLEKQAQSK